MPVLTRSQTRFIAERDRSYADMKSLNARHANAVGAFDTCRTLSKALDFIHENRHINDLLKTCRVFRRAVYVNCYKLLQNPLCTKQMKNTCLLLRRKINEIGVWA